MNHPIVRYKTPDGTFYGAIDSQQSIQRLRDFAWGAPLHFGDSVDELEHVELLCPVASPEKIICVGANYAEHAKEMGGDAPSKPVIFNKFPTALNHPGAAIEIPPISQKVDYEAELVVVIGKAGRNIPQDSAMEHVFGACCGNDITARDWQKGQPGGQWLLGKTIDGFAPIGPWVTPRENVDFARLDIQLRLNGTVMQKANTSQMIFTIDFLIAHVSKFCELRPGDLLFTGTPSGVGMGRTPELYLKPGDELEVEIEGLGVLRNRMTG